jgi:Tti2 family
MTEVSFTEILELEGEPSLPLLKEVLAKHIKPIFQTNPHPMLNVETGRKLPRTAGGYSAAQDAFEGQVWKEHPGVVNVLLWCVQRIHVRAYIPASAHAELYHDRLKRTNACGTLLCPR